MTYHDPDMKQCECGKWFKKSPTDSTVRCPDCRRRKAGRAVKRTGYKAITCCRCGQEFTELKCPRCGI